MVPLRGDWNYSLAVGDGALNVPSMKSEMEKCGVWSLNKCYVNFTVGNGFDRSEKVKFFAQTPGLVIANQ